MYKIKKLIENLLIESYYLDNNMQKIYEEKGMVLYIEIIIQEFLRLIDSCAF